VIVVAGGTGRLGRSVVSRLTAQGVPVRVFARGLSGEVPDGTELVRGDIRRDADVAGAVEGADVVISAVQGFAGPGRVSPRSVDRDGNRRLIEAAAGVGADVVLVSVTHAAADSPLEIAREKYAAEQFLRAAGIEWSVVRSAAFAELWIQILEDTAGRAQRPRVFGRGQTPLWWVSVEDVAHVVARVALDPSARGHVFDVVGPEPLSLEELAERVMWAHAWSGTPRRVPRPALRAGAMTVGAIVPPVGRQLRAALALDALGPESPEAVASAQAAGRTDVDTLLRSPDGRSTSGLRGAD
jgi:NADH dehydrogenase